MKTEGRYKLGDLITVLWKYPKPRTWAESRKRLIEEGWTTEEADEELKEMQQYYEGQKNKP